MTITESAYVAALEKKLIEAERALYGFRAIWNNLSSEGIRLQEADRPSISPPSKDGLYPGQLPPLPHPEDLEESHECVE